MRNTLARIAPAMLTLAAVAGVAVAPAPAEAAPVAARAAYKTCNTVVRNITVNGRKVTRLAVTGNPAPSGKVYGFKLQWGWDARWSTYVPRYRSTDVPRHSPLHKARAWVNGYECNPWASGDLFSAARATMTPVSYTAPAANAVAIRCSTRVFRYTKTGKLALQVLSNAYDKHRVYAFWVYRYGSSTPRKIIPTYSIWSGTWNYPLYRITKVRSWQSGHECNSWWVGRSASSTTLVSFTTPLASPAGMIRCWIKTPTPISGGRQVIRIGSNHPTTAKVHAVSVKWNSGFPSNNVKWRRYSPISSNYVTPAMKGYRIDQIIGGQQGTPCTEYVR